MLYKTQLLALFRHAFPFFRLQQGLEMRFVVLASVNTLSTAIGLIGCTTLSESQTSNKDPEVNWSNCVQDIPSVPDTPTNPYPRVQDYPWMSRNEWCTRVMAILKDPARADARLGFMGDSITQMWPRDVWSHNFAEYSPILMGIGGDKTQTLLWRMDNGELKGLSLETIVLLIGTNNLGAGDSPEEVQQGIKLTIDHIKKYQPQARIVLMAIFPREESPEAPLRLKVQETNQLLAASAKEWNVDLLDIGSRLVEKDGSISQRVMGDFVHLTAEGYRIWADAVLSLMKKTKPPV